MPSFRKFFKKGIKNCYPLRSAAIQADTDRYFSQFLPDVAFARKSANPMDRRLVFSAYFLALIRALEDRGEDFEQIRNICLSITHAYVTPRSAWHSFLRKLPARLIGTGIGKYMIAKIGSRISSRGHVDGFRASLILEKEKTYGLGYGVDIHECGICKLFAKHGAFAYASILCEVDKLTSGLAGLDLIRNGTIAYGADKCDFRWRRI